MRIKTSAITFILLLAVFAGWNAAQINAQEQASRGTEAAAVFGSVGIAYGQTAQLNVVNAGVPPDPISPVAVEMRIMDGTGNVLVRDRVNLEAGQMTSLQLNADAIPRGTYRLNLNALVIIRHPDDNFNAKMVVSTLEIIDSDTRRSSIILNPATLLGFNPQPEPPERQLEEEKSDADKMSKADLNR